jgi:L-ascorbate metabolism protein UlaG (beta-lactamase superfamily)
VTNQHVKDELTSKRPAEDNFTAVTALERWDSVLISASGSGTSDAAKAIRITATPAAKSADDGLSSGAPEYMNQLRTAMSLPVNGYIIQLGHARQDAEFEVEYTIYFTGDTVMVDELKEIPKRFPKIDLMLLHLGGAKLPGPGPPNIMISMDAEQGVELTSLIRPSVTIPIYYDDYGAPHIHCSDHALG